MALRRSRYPRFGFVGYKSGDYCAGRQVRRAVSVPHLAGTRTDQHLFATFDDVREAVYWRMIEYNEERPHDALEDLTPVEARLQSAGNSTYELSP